MKYLKEYVNKINSGEIVACKRIKTIYNRILNELSIEQYIFSQERADRAREFIQTFCRHSKGELAGENVKLALFQNAFISALFGILDRKSKLRRFREALFIVGRKNGKSVFASGISLYMLIGDGESGAEVYSAATKKDQAKIIFTECYNMVKQDPYLRKHIRKRKSDLYFGATLSTMEALGRNSNSLDGLNSHMVVIDELHSITDRNLYEVLQQSMSARREPLLLMITTAGTIRENIFDNMYEYGCNVVDEVFEDKNFLPVIYELDEKKEWLDPTKWIKANPGLGITKTQDYIERQIEKAKNDVRLLPGTLTKDFNIRETNGSAWMSFEDFNNTEKFNITDYKGFRGIGGADLSKTGDLTSASIIFMNKETGKIFVEQMYWIPEDVVQDRIKLDKIPYDIWHSMGLIRFCKGNDIDYSDVTDWFLEMRDYYDIMPIWTYYDSYSAKYWVKEMESHGFDMVKCIQGYQTLSLPFQKLGKELESKRINYNNNPILKWCISNTGTEVDRNGNIMPKKCISPKQRIDGVASLLNCYVGLYEHYDEYVDYYL